MTNLLIIYEAYEPTNAETVKFHKELSEQYPVQTKAKTCMEIRCKDIDWADIILSVRCTDRFSRDLAIYAKKLKKLWVVLLDDDFLSLGNDYGSEGQGYRTSRKKNLVDILAQTDWLITCNKKLAQKYSAIGNIKNVVFVDTAIDVVKISPPTRKSGKIKIVYYVNDGTKDIFEKFMRPVFAVLAEKYADKVSIFFLGVKPDMTECADKLEINYVPHMTYDDFLRFLGDNDFNIGIAPLNEKGFNQYKYFNKFIEYTRAGIPGIYSDVEIYRQVVMDGVNGLLCKNDIASWTNAITYLMDNEDKRYEIAVTAQRNALDRFSKDKLMRNYVESFLPVLSYKSGKKKSKQLVLIIIKLDYWRFRISGWIGTVLNCIRTGNYQRIRNRIASFLKGEV